MADKIAGKTKTEDVRACHYSLTIPVELIIGTGKEIDVFSIPKPPKGLVFYPETITSSAPCENFVVLHSIQADRKILSPFRTVMYMDAYALRSAMSTRLAYPYPAIRFEARMVGQYTGLVPAGFKSGEKRSFSVTLTGPATLPAADDIE
jgi:hypothetical protein